MKASVKTFNKCKFSPAGCWNIDLWAEAGKFTPTDVEREAHPRFHALRLIFLFEVAAGLASMKFIPVGRAYSKAFTRDRLREGKKKKNPSDGMGIASAKTEHTHHPPACVWGWETLVSLRSNTTWRNRKPSENWQTRLLFPFSTVLPSGSLQNFLCSTDLPAGICLALIGPRKSLMEISSANFC